MEKVLKVRYYEKVQNDNRFESIYSQFADSVFNFCYSKLQNLPDAEDASSDTFLWILQNIHRLQTNDRKKLKGLIMQIAIHKSIDIARKRRKKAIPFDSDSQIEGQTISPDEYMLRETDFSRIKDAIQLLPDKYNTILTLKYQQGCDPKTIAEALNISVEHFRVELCRAHKILSKILRETK